MQIIRNDGNYKLAKNYSHSFYNFPVTLNFDDKKFIIGAGNSDSIDIIDNFILTVNSRLGYAGLEYFDENNVFDVVFLQNSQDFEGCENFFDLPVLDQLKYLQNWM